MTGRSGAGGAPLALGGYPEGQEVLRAAAANGGRRTGPEREEDEMNQTKRWQKTLIAALVAASLTAPAGAAERGRPAGARGGWWAGAPQGAALALAAWWGALGRWTAVWGEEGPIIDPDGQHGTAPPTTTSGGTAATSTAPSDAGHI
jgi:hypothetical protein